MRTAKDFEFNMKVKTIAVDCACGHSHEIDRPDTEYGIGRACDEWSDKLCPNCELNGNTDMWHCIPHDVWFKDGDKCWQCKGSGKMWRCEKHKAWIKVGDKCPECKGDKT